MVRCEGVWKIPEHLRAVSVLRAVIGSGTMWGIGWGRGGREAWDSFSFPKKKFYSFRDSGKYFGCTVGRKKLLTGTI